MATGIQTQPVAEVHPSIAAEVPVRRPLFVYFGHHKCASTYVKYVLRELSQLLGLRYAIQDMPQVLPLNYQDRTAEARARVQSALGWVANPPCDVLCLGNAERVYLDTLNAHDFRGFHVIRDPRDMIVSGYFSHKNSHPAHPDFNPWMVEHRARLQACDREDGLIQEIDYSSAYFEHMRSWDYHHPRVLETRFEVLTRNPRQEFARILEFIGIELVPEGKMQRAWRRLASWSGRLLTRSDCPIYRVCARHLHDILDQQSFRQLSGGRAVGQEDAHHHFRKGVAGDWRQHFTPRIKKVFKDRFGDLLLQLGYEQSDDW